MWDQLKPISILPDWLKMLKSFYKEYHERKNIFVELNEIMNNEEHISHRYQRLTIH